MEAEHCSMGRKHELQPPLPPNPSSRRDRGEEMPELSVCQDSC